LRPKVIYPPHKVMASIVGPGEATQWKKVSGGTGYQFFNGQTWLSGDPTDAQKQASGLAPAAAGAPSASGGMTSLDTIGAQMTPAQFADVADQIRNGSTNSVTVGGKQYSISPQNVSHITQSFPGSPNVQAPKAQTYFGPGATAQAPESAALSQISQIDPASEQLRNALSQSYLTPLQQGGNLNLPALPTQGAPSAATLQSYLNTYKGVDPTGLAGRQALEQQLTSQAALGSQLDPETEREITQGVRQGQSARGNIYGTPQLVQEAMTRGQAGLALQQQRQQALQGFLQSGQDVGSVANNLYQQGNANYLQNYQNYLNAYNTQQGNQRAAQGAALGYLGSGTTPYQTATGYLNNAQQNAAAAAQGGPVYNPSALGQGYTGAGAPSFPQYGLDMSQNANQWFNSMNAYNQPMKSGGNLAGAAGGALSGAASGAAAGSTIMPGWGTLIGGAAGAIGGGLSGYSR
jgi:hypothetical protein